MGGAKGPTGTSRDANRVRVRSSDLGLLGQLKGIVNLDPQVAHGAFQLGMA